MFALPIGGTLMEVPWAIDGSGSTYIWGIMDAEYQAGMSKAQTEAFCIRAISLAMARDGSSGGMVRLGGKRPNTCACELRLEIRPRRPTTRPHLINQLREPGEHGGFGIMAQVSDERGLVCVAQVRLVTVDAQGAQRRQVTCEEMEPFWEDLDVRGLRNGGVGGIAI